MRSNLTPERRAAFRALAKELGGVSKEKRAAIAARLGAVTVEGHSLSIGNACLLAMQLPTVSMVGGTQQWERAGRHVPDDERPRGLMIWAPVTTATDPEDVERDASGRSVRFIPVTVFDVSQTDAGVQP